VKGLGEPTTCELKSPWIDLKREVIFDKNDIQVVQQAVVKQQVILKKDYASKAFDELRNQARKCFYRTGLLFKTL